METYPDITKKMAKFLGTKRTDKMAENKMKAEQKRLAELDAKLQKKLIEEAN